MLQAKLNDDFVLRLNDAADTPGMQLSIITEISIKAIIIDNIFFIGSFPFLDFLKNNKAIKINAKKPMIPAKR